MLGIVGGFGADINTGARFGDLVSMTIELARSLAAEPRVNELYAKRGARECGCPAGENNLTGEILAGGQAEVLSPRTLSAEQTRAARSSPG